MRDQQTHDITGLKNNPLKIENGEIRLELQKHQIDFKICDFEDLTDYPPYKGGTFTGENGLEIDLERFINNLILDPVATHKLKTAGTEVEYDDKCSDRMIMFIAIIDSRLDGNIPQYDTPTA